MRYSKLIVWASVALIAAISIIAIERRDVDTTAMPIKSAAAQMGNTQVVAPTTKALREVGTYASAANAPLDIGARPSQVSTHTESTSGLYELFDEQVKADLAPPAWFYSGTSVASDIAALDAEASVNGLRCGPSVCRVDIVHASEVGRGRFFANLQRDGAHHFASFATLARFSTEEPGKTALYIADRRTLRDSASVLSPNSKFQTSRLSRYAGEYQ